MFKKGFLAAVVALAMIASYSRAEALPEGRITHDPSVQAVDASSGEAARQQADSSNQAAHVPEPATLALLGIGALIMLHRRPERFIGQDAEDKRETAAVAVVVCTWQDRPQAERKDMSSLMAK